MKVICGGYRKYNGPIVRCGKVLKKGPEKNSEASTGTCPKCYKETLKQIRLWHKEEKKRA